MKKKQKEPIATEPFRKLIDQPPEKVKVAANYANDRHKDKGVLVRLPEELKKRLSDVAKKHSTTMKAIIEKGTENRVEELEKKDPV